MSTEGRPSREVRELARAIRRQKRVVLLFVFAIVLPAATLGFFGLRALQADRFRIEGFLKKEREEALRRADGRLRERVRTIQERLQRLEAQSEIPGTLLRVTAAGDVTFVRERYRIRALEPDPRLSARGPDILEAERLEYQSRDFSAAARRYARLSRDDDPYVRSLALVGLARTSLRLGRSNDAFSAYRRLLREIPAELERETSAHALLAGLQIASLGEEALEELLSGYALLLRDRWILSGELAHFYASELEREIEKRCSGKDCTEYLDLRGRREERLRAIESLEDLHRRLSRALGSWASSELPPNELVLELPERRSVVVGIRTGEREARASVVSDESLAELPPEAGIALQITNSRGDVLYGPAAIPPAEQIDTMTLVGEGLPSWSLTAFQESSGSLLASRRNLYLGLTTALALWLLFGALLTARSLRQEMALVGMKTELVSLVSHEFKSPITSLRALVDGLRGGSVSDPARVGQYLAVASSELQRLTRLVNNLLDFSRIEAGTRRYRLGPCDLGALLRDLLLHFDARAGELGFQIESRIDPVPEVSADADAVSQAVLNLLDNAVKSSGERKWIGVELTSLGEQVDLAVSDRGKGIPHEEFGRLFETSHRAESSSDGRGLGLGLPIVKHVMDGHGGRVEVESEPGKGSTFRLLFPVQEVSMREGTAYADSAG